MKKKQQLGVFNIVITLVMTILGNSGVLAGDAGKTHARPGGFPGVQKLESIHSAFVVQGKRAGPSRFFRRSDRDDRMGIQPEGDNNGWPDSRPVPENKPTVSLPAAGQS